MYFEQLHICNKLIKPLFRKIKPNECELTEFTHTHTPTNSHNHLHIHAPPHTHTQPYTDMRPHALHAPHYLPMISFTFILIIKL